jgi:subtilisin family serine protease
LSVSEPPIQEEQERDLGDQYAPYVISPVLLKAYEGDESRPTIIDVSLDFPGGPEAARARVRDLVEEVGGEVTPIESRQHVFARLTLSQLQALIAADAPITARSPIPAAVEAVLKDYPGRAIYKVWADNPLQAHLDRSVKIVKADACIRAFGSEGGGIVWAVIDSGVEASHPHFVTHANLRFDGDNAPAAIGSAPIDPNPHKDFTGEGDPLLDNFGHGTHVAGIIAGITPTPAAGVAPLHPGAVRLVKRRDTNDSVRLIAEALPSPLSGVAPRCKLVSLKVLDANGAGGESALLAALDYVDTLNSDGERLRIHGVNISIGFNFDAEWFAAGQSPVCVAVNRLVRHNVLVVVSAGNEGSVLLRPEGAASLKRIGLSQSIADPGNAELAITVGSTHPESPHTFGVSYFSSRGPTADGRAKPDLVAPGERIVSCASAGTVQSASQDPALDTEFEPAEGCAYYREESGTSMAAPHVSGAAAAFLSIHREFIGQPEKVKAAFVENATDLGRKREFQGSGLLDLLRAIQAV